MSVDSIIMMIVAIGVVWGGLVVAIFNLMRTDRSLGEHRDL